MNREHLRRGVLIVLGLLFIASIYPIVLYLRNPGDQPPGDTMMMSLYFTLGIFLLLAARNPVAHRSLISYAGWANVAHGAVMVAMAFRIPKDRHDFLVAAAVAIAIGICLIAVTPARPTAQLASATGG